MSADKELQTAIDIITAIAELKAENKYLCRENAELREQKKQLEAEIERKNTLLKMFAKEDNRG